MFVFQDGETGVSTSQLARVTTGSIASDCCDDRIDVGAQVFNVAIAFCDFFIGFSAGPRATLIDDIVGVVTSEQTTTVSFLYCKNVEERKGDEDVVFIISVGRDVFRRNESGSRNERKSYDQQ